MMDSSDVLAVISNYARSWSLLQAYDEQSLGDTTLTQFAMQPLELDEVLNAIAALKKDRSYAVGLF